MSDFMRVELNPTTEGLSSSVAEAAAIKTVSSRFRDLGEKAGNVARVVANRAGLTGAVLALLISSGCGNVENPVTLTPDGVTVHVTRAAEAPVDLSSDGVKVTIIKAEKEEDKIAREKAEALFPGIHFKSLREEAEPIISQFSETDGTWNEKRTQGYVFDAFKGQRLTTVAEETVGYSYIKSDLYNEQGEPVTGDLDTRVEFVAPKTGRYHVLVQNLKNGTEAYSMRLEDRDKSGIVVKIRGADGKEYFLSEGKKVPEVGFLNFGFMVNTNKDVNLELITPVIYALPGNWEQFQQEAFFPEDDPKNMVPTKVTRLDDGRVFVEPENGGLLPGNSQIVMNFSTGSNSKYTFRIFTTTP